MGMQSRYLFMKWPCLSMGAALAAAAAEGAWQGAAPEVEPAPSPGAAVSRTLTRRALWRLRRLLARPELSFLGAWAGNESMLAELHTRLSSGELAVVPDFLRADVAETVREDTLRGISMGWLRPVGTPMSRLGLDGPMLAEIASPSLPPAERCRMLRALDDRLGFKFRYHVLDPRNAGHEIKAADFPGQMRLYSGFASKTWTKALMLLLTGSHEVPDGADFELPFYREYRPEDYALFHNDVDGSNKYRALCMNYWLSKQVASTNEDADASLGGSFLWCGPADSTGRFPEARRLPPAWNTASIFAPCAGSWHAVEAVQESAPASGLRRLSFTSWLSAPRPPRASGKAPPGSEDEL
mmetsp:Transcript_152776/g.490055  ORF Transcript_152776/g.490055 Transcript_152776/m.490055 type:complete len:354 (+) Transcript_152776:1-1062(+)